MFGARKEKRQFVVMDGSNKRFMDEIIGITKMATGQMRWYNIIKPRALDKDHPTMLVVSVRSTYEDFDHLRKILEREYPEQCVFDMKL